MGSPPLLISMVPPYLQDGQDVFLHRKPLEDGGLLREITHPHPGPLVDGEPANVLPLEVNPAVIRPYQPHYYVEGGTLTGTVMAQKPYYLPLFYLHVQAIQHHPFAVYLGKIFNL